MGGHHIKRQKDSDLARKVSKTNSTEQELKILVTHCVQDLDTVLTFLLAVPDNQKPCILYFEVQECLPYLDVEMHYLLVRDSMIGSTQAGNLLTFYLF